MASQNPTAAPSLRMTLGAVYIGATVAAILFGITNLQAVIYYRKYSDDWWIYQYSVAILWAFDALHVALGTHALYHYLIDLFGDYVALNDVVWSFKLQILFNMVIIIGVQAIYTVRIWRLGHHFHQILPWFVVLCVAISGGTGIFTVYDSYVITSFLSIHSIKVSIYVVFSMAPISDFLIAFSMCYYLHKSRESAAFSSTSKMLLGLMRLVVISGLATSTCSLITLITYLALPNSLIFLGIHFILPKLYINSLLAMLNSRKDHRVPTNGRHSVAKVLKFEPQDSAVDNEEAIAKFTLFCQDVSLPMQSVQSLDHGKEVLNFQI
ncbi:hypothetical protein F5146DRAFT_1122517 [Armillaria mellea]|nr:hypothetical protein F5146DRAFT_1122517 [Armillaria mellea]